MRLDLDNIEEYDVRSLRGIIASCEEERNRLKALRQAAEINVKNIEVAERYFESENLERAKRINQKYAAKLEQAEKEIAELLTSVNEFAERLNRAWNQEW